MVKIWCDVPVELAIHRYARQATKVTGTYEARYRELAAAKTSLDHNGKAAALNLIRLDAWWNGEVLSPRRTSRLASQAERRMASGVGRRLL